MRRLCVVMLAGCVTIAPHLTPIWFDEATHGGIISYDTRDGEIADAMVDQFCRGPHRTTRVDLRQEGFVQARYGSRIDMVFECTAPVDGGPSEATGHR
ncbi:MAG: hypothetical protein IPJ65_36205 [Archangiaceae bacterium]|nr:hypothetical protein [Archangiaceae bacterium]